MADPIGGMRPVRSTTILLTGALAAVPILLGSPAGALSKPALPWDVNGDGYAELALAAPGEANGLVVRSGAVTLLRGTRNGPTTTGARTISQSTAGVIGTNETGDRFGSGLTSCDFDRDGYADLAIGAAGERIGDLTGADNPVGTVSILYGSATGVGATGNQILDPTLLGVNDVWGTVLECGDLNGDGFADLAIGNGGNPYVTTPPDCCLFEEHPLGVSVFYGSAEGLDPGGIHLTAALATGEPDGNPAYGGFGNALAVGDLDGDGRDELVLPSFQEIDDVRGGIFVFDGHPAGIATEASTVIPTVPDLDERFDIVSNFDFSAAAAIGDFNADGRGDLVLGTGTVSASQCSFDGNCPGSVLVLPGSDEGLNLDGGRVWHAGTPGVAGQPNVNDNFGATLTTGDLNGDGRDDLAIGSIGKDVGGAKRTGGVTLLYGGSAGLTAAGSQVWVQSSPGIPGDNETDDRFGSELLISPLRGATRSGLVIGIPSEDVGAVVDAGAATVLLGGPGGLTSTGAKTWSQASVGVPGDAERHDWFGLAGGTFEWPRYVPVR